MGYSGFFYIALGAKKQDPLIGISLAKSYIILVQCFDSSVSSLCMLLMHFRILCLDLNSLTSCFSPKSVSRILFLFIHSSISFNLIVKIDCASQFWSLYINLQTKELIFLFKLSSHWLYL